jgi:hypothetical protein
MPNFEHRTLNCEIGQKWPKETLGVQNSALVVRCSPMLCRLVSDNVAWHRLKDATLCLADGHEAWSGAEILKLFHPIPVQWV